MELEIIYKDITCPKLTIGTHRFVLKFPNEFQFRVNNGIKERIIKLAHEVFNDIHSEEMNTRRGRFDMEGHQLIISMTIEGNKKKIDPKTYKEKI